MKVRCLVIASLLVSIPAVAADYDAALDAAKRAAWIQSGAADTQKQIERWARGEAAKRVPRNAVWAASLLGVVRRRELRVPLSNNVTARLRMKEVGMEVRF